MPGIPLLDVPPDVDFGFESGGPRQIVEDSVFPCYVVPRIHHTRP